MNVQNIPESVPVDPRYNNGIGKGWYPIVEELHKQMLAVDPGYTIQQIKEKFGGLRYYWEPTPDADGFFDYSDEAKIATMRALVSFAEALASRTCEACGLPGSLRSSTGWYVTLCDGCENQRETKRNGSISA